jgi:DNA-directed RNA polymerase subunit beta'
MNKENPQFNSLKIQLASPNCVRKWAERTMPDGKVVGEVTKAETINYRTFKPEMDGLFCEKIFGPIKDWECHCGRCKRVRQEDRNYDRLYCSVCGVEVTESKVRRYRMGYIKLASPVTHVWYLKSIPSYLSILLDLKVKEIERVVYYNDHIAENAQDYSTVSPEPWNYWSWAGGQSYQLETRGADFDLKGKLLTPVSSKTFAINIIDNVGAQAIEEKLAKKNFKAIAEFLGNEMKLILKKMLVVKTEKEYNYLLKKKKKIARKFRLITYFLEAGIDPKWMIIHNLPVLPPDLRPMVQLDSGRFASSDLNDLYRRVINRNNRLIKFTKILVPDLILRNEKRLLQEAVDTLIDNGRRGKAVLGTNNRPLKSLSDIIEGKQGRFRQNLLGKRVDYSGRSVIVVGPNLRLYQCGLPREMALELFQPFIIRKLIELQLTSNIRGAKIRIQQGGPMIREILKQVVQGHPILLNRAPTLHRLGIQAFQPVLIDGRAIQLHPLVCPAFNADFDGDQMAVHVPLSIEAQTEARLLMLASNNWLSPATGQPILLPSQDMVLGCYYLTIENLSPSVLSKKAPYFHCLEDALLAYEQKKLSTHDFVWVKWEGSLESYSKEEEPIEIRVEKSGRLTQVYRRSLIVEQHQKVNCIKYIRTTIGRILINSLIIENLNE